MAEKKRAEFRHFASDHSAVSLKKPFLTGMKAGSVMVPRTVANAMKRRGLFGHSISPTSTEIDVRSSSKDVSVGSIHPI
jgi:hypothetical protein